jgi:ABC-type sugar transport system permease subunit
MHMFWRSMFVLFVLFLLAIMLSVLLLAIALSVLLRFTDYGYPFGIFKLFLGDTYFKWITIYLSYIVYFSYFLNNENKWRVRYKVLIISEKRKSGGIIYSNCLVDVDVCLNAFYVIVTWSSICYMVKYNDFTQVYFFLYKSPIKLTAMI